MGGDAASGQPRFAFVHGNWALANSRPDGRWCGVNEELEVLRQCGCYADFTMPSAPDPTQTRRINSIYYATGDPSLPKSHDDGDELGDGCRRSDDVVLVQGPLCVTWTPLGHRFLPKLENGNLAAGAPPTSRRLAAWLRTRVCVAGRPDWLFVKLHTHGCNESNWEALLGPPMVAMHRRLALLSRDGGPYALHYVTAREMYNIARAAESGASGDPGQYRDFHVGAPPLRAVSSAATAHSTEKAS
jgi:hypothetical protein